MQRAANSLSVLFAWAGALLMPGLALEAAAAELDEFKEVPLELEINEQQPGTTFIALRDAQGGIWLEESDFARLRLRLRNTPFQIFEQRRYFPLAAIDGASIEIDEAQQRARVRLPPEAFAATQLAVKSSAETVITRAAPGAFLNYQLSAQHVADSTLSAGFAELGIFSSLGVLTNSAVVRSQQAQTKLVRLDTAFTRDFPNRIERLVIGDSISNAGSWGSSLRYAGVSWGTEFAVRPDLVTTPLLSASGTAEVPSTLDVFINNQRVSSQSLPPGPFLIDRLPAISGSGEISLVVRDALGREKIIAQPFYSSPSLLAPGLSAYTVNAGRIRNRYTTSSSDYGDWIGEATYRRGLSSAITLEGHGEIQQSNAHALGLNLAASIGRFGVFNMTGAFGGDQDNSGSLLGAGFESRGTRLGFTANTSFASAGYRQIAHSFATTTQFKRRDLVQAGLDLNRAGSLSVAYVRELYRADPAQYALSLAHNLAISHWGTLSFIASQTRSERRTTEFFLTFTMPLGERRAVSVSALGSSGSDASPTEVYGTFLQNPPAGPGLGYRVDASTRSNYDLDGRWQSQVGDLELQAVRAQGISGQNLFWTGGLTLLGGEIHATRSITDSFALIDVGGIPDVPVYIDHQLITHTDQNGRAMLHALLPYQANRINIDPLELPLDTSIATHTLVLAPAFRSGVIARFPVERVRGGTFRLVTKEGVPIPVGAQVEFNGGFFPVTNDGLVYVTGYDHGMGGLARWSEGSCNFRVEPPPSDDPLPDLGTIVCRSTVANVVASK